MRIKLSAALLVAALGLSACGDTPLEQGVFGMGAGTGAALLTGADPVTGAIVGAAGNVAYCQYVNQANCR
ncbi:hypothetical protein [Psychromarinibacter halotolerans]|uniref:Lipoprotein n=1 Tax=Psychromarinibacter halotolerans TaxID=1775175 RepID=A0ABV7GQG2_9RHOB|nr:hypothetical protein [Psychromarinibacter halotolerans]MAQ86184.1 hypothetical protein [Maritimibacter sp.]MDF0596665.1 hypothetical protein [Psychromarinibacter halotolerans]